MITFSIIADKILHIVLHLLKSV